MNYEQLIERSAKKRALVKELYKEIVLMIDDYVEGVYIDYNVQKAIQTVIEDVCYSLRGYRPECIFAKMYTEREYNANYGYEDGGTDAPKFEGDMSPLHKELFKYYKNDYTATGINGAKFLKEDLIAYAKEVYNKYPENKVSTLIYAELTNNDKLYYNCENDVKQLLSEKSINSIVALQENYMNLDCLNINWKNLPKKRLEVLLYVLKNELRSLRNEKMRIEAMMRNSWNEEKYFQEKEECLLKIEQYEKRIADIELKLKNLTSEKEVER